MTKRADRIATYAETLSQGLRIVPDVALLTAVTLGCGPLVHSPATEVIDLSDPQEITRLRRNFLIRKLGLRDGPALTDAIDSALATCAPLGPRPFRAVVHYVLVRQTGREGQFR